ncbi:excisionase family DNA-binding protein [Solirubrobacter ginsenosidimutans]|uniref:Excisionase family DNA-binding protein n=1 Tax=Solirubrobacter ginsenosidimutans TaxID=490573 RepID=A0A9X3MLW3_9ACTN|nr:HD domain-containing phosphohydrolase [Solirubrobacter ginsenosidimutans]MDA0158946.1 excisionase family DNA-binding protein [Solirubrobacter ginsenosidimutans]
MIEPRAHLQRISAYCIAICGPLGADPEVLAPAAWLHDLGMVAMNVGVRPGPLTERERRELLTHPEIGHALLAGSSTPVLELASRIALTHHEHFDGGGYPRGIAAEEIPLAGRIVAVADAFDALVTNRVYRRAGSVAEAAGVLRAQRGQQFDPQVVDAFLDAMDAMRSVLTKYRAGECGAPEDYVTVSTAASVLAIPPSRVRRWADEGRLEVTRTPGGHRRFRLDDVRRLAADERSFGLLRSIALPRAPLPKLAGVLRTFGGEITTATVAAVYGDEPPGWFATSKAQPALRAWRKTLLDASVSGDFGRTLEASVKLMREAQAHSASLLERHTFLERFGQVTVRVLSRATAEPDELAGTRRLMAALQRHLLALQG